MNPLVELQAYGQSFWYDNIQRRFLQDGTLQRLIADDGLRGITSNPSIFQKAIGGSTDYDEQVRSLAVESINSESIYEALALQDIRQACDLFAELYEESGRGDGFVSLEVSPHLARDTEGTVAEARRLFSAVERPNVMIKVPATPEGIPAVRQLIGGGINVNITLMFSMNHYEAVARAYIDGITDLVRDSRDPGSTASVASFFVSRVDSLVDQKLSELNDPAADALMGKIAIANSRLVYDRFKKIFHGEMFNQLTALGARAQRLLWASTSTKNPEYPDTLYINELIGPETVNTIPPATVDAFRDHGRVANTLAEGVGDARELLGNLSELQIDLEQLAEQLQQDGVVAFANSFDALLDTIDEKRAALARQ